MAEQNLLLLGDVNLHLDNAKDYNTKTFLTHLSDRGLEQHVSVPTHKKGHQLDVVITREILLM